MNTKIKFINFLMKELDLSVKEMKHFLDVKSKTIYNYRQMEFNELPEKVKKRFYILFRKNSGKEIQKELSVMDRIDLVDLRDSLLISARLRYKLMETGFNESLKKEYLETNKITAKDNIERSKGYWNQINQIKNIENRDDSINPNYSNKQNTNKIKIESEKVTELFLKVLETELNNKIDYDDYEFIAYLKKYKK